MSVSTIDASVLTEAALALYDEGFAGLPGQDDPVWFTDGGTSNGLLGTLGALSAAEASRSSTPGDRLTIASHAGHLRFSLAFANRAARGENPYADADWAASWAVRVVGETEWKELLASLRREYEDFRAFIASGKAWDSRDMLTGVFGNIAHGAWHLGAIRQALGLITAPGD